MSAYDTTTALPADAEPIPAAVRLTALRQALERAGTATAALIDLSAKLREAGAPGLAWDSDYLIDGVDALTGAIALLLKSEEQPTGSTGQGEDDRLGQAD